MYNLPEQLVKEWESGKYYSAQIDRDVLIQKITKSVDKEA